MFASCGGRIKRSSKDSRESAFESGEPDCLACTNTPSVRITQGDPARGQQLPRSSSLFSQPCRSQGQAVSRARPGSGPRWTRARAPLPLRRDLRGNKMTELTPGSGGVCPGCCVVKVVLSCVLSRRGTREDE